MSSVLKTGFQWDEPEMIMVIDRNFSQTLDFLERSVREGRV
jgi:hypothetical protein